MVLRIFIGLTLLFSSGAFAEEQHKDHKMPPTKMNKAFDQLKKLVGKWEGKTKMGDQEQDVIASYELTSGGNAIIEKLFAGTPHEMVSVYYPSGKGVAMTHYCMLGNQPQMTLKKSTDNSVAFEMVGNKGISSPKEMHMHGLTIKWNDESTITQEWTSRNKGKKQPPSVFQLKKST